MDTPVLEVAILKISIHNFGKGILVLWKIVPDVRETQLRQLLHLYKCCCVEISQYFFPHGVHDKYWVSKVNRQMSYIPLPRPLCEGNIW